VDGCIKEMVGGLLEGRKHEHTLLHLCNAEASNAKHLTLRQ
jgi:hypothetical protein